MTPKRAKEILKQLLRDNDGPSVAGRVRQAMTDAERREFEGAGAGVVGIVMLAAAEPDPDWKAGTRFASILETGRHRPTGFVASGPVRRSTVAPFDLPVLVVDEETGVTYEARREFLEAV